MIPSPTFSGLDIIKLFDKKPGHVLKKENNNSKNTLTEGRYYGE